MGYETIIFNNEHDKSSASNTNGYDMLSRNIINLLVSESSKVSGSLLKFVEQIDSINIFKRDKMLFRNNKASLYSIEASIDKINKFLTTHYANSDDNMNDITSE
jgi:hypothetical protein